VIRSAALLAAAILLAGCSNQTTGTATKMATQGYAFAPAAFYKFCASDPALCSTRGKVKAVELTPRLEAELASVNKSVNRRIKERGDRDSAGRADVWGLPTGEGDCEDFAILKKAELLKRGWPASAMLLTVATLGGAGHTVLTVRTNQGDLVLDNRTGAIRNWSRTSYRYFARQSQSENGKWTRIRT
jgi:predicted transglutaminase-like cysteine proteinase